MSKKRVIALFGALIICISISYSAYRVYHAWQLNLRLEKFMAGQIKSIQNRWYDDQWFDVRQLPKPGDLYLIHRSEAFYIEIGKANIEGLYDSYWISEGGDPVQVTVGEYTQRSVSDSTISWRYFIRPKSGSVVCVILEAPVPGSSHVGTSSWTLDTSKTNWQLEHGPFECEFRDKDLFRTLLLPVN